MKIRQQYVPWILIGIVALLCLAAGFLYFGKEEDSWPS